MIARFAAALAALALAGSAAAAPPPHMSISDFAQLRTPLPFPYDEHANATAAVLAARLQARREHKLLLIDLGGNWCGDCRILSATTDLPGVYTHPWLLEKRARHPGRQRAPSLKRPPGQPRRRSLPPLPAW